MAGYPETPIWDSSSNLSILFQAVAGGGYHPGAYNVGLGHVDEISHETVRQTLKKTS